MRLVSFVLCPFAQRCAIVLREKAIAHETEYIDLFDKPRWLFAISPLGKVPLLEVDGTVLFESSVINEFLEEVGGAPAMHPPTPLARARSRMWIEFASKVAGDGHRLMLAPDRETALQAAEDLRASLGMFEALLGAGPFFGGDTPGLVDAAVAPALQRLAWCEAIEPELDCMRELPKVARWRAALLARPSIRDSLPLDVEHTFVDFLQGRGSPARNVASSWLGTLAATRR